MMTTRSLRLPSMLILASSFAIAACGDDGGGAIDTDGSTDEGSSTGDQNTSVGPTTSDSAEESTTSGGGESSTTSGGGEESTTTTTSDGESSGSTGDPIEPYPFEPMAVGVNGFTVEPFFTVGETLADTTGALNSTTAGDYTPPGILDGLGAIELDANTVRIFANHELLNFRGYDYEVSDGAGGTFTLDGARVSYFDVDKATRRIVDAGLAINTIYDATGTLATDNTFLANDLIGLSRFCSSVLVDAEQFGNGRGIADTIYFTGEEDGGGFNPVGGAVWALDVETGAFWLVPDMGRGSWENVTEIDTGTTTHVAFLLADDSSPFDAGGDAEDEAAPLYLYVGEKDAQSDDFLARNGLRDGNLYVWVADNGNTRPSQFNGAGTSRAGSWVQIENGTTTEGNANTPSEDGSTGFDEYGYPTQRTLWLRAEAAGAFGFSRPEDLDVNPDNGAMAVLASTGVDTYDVVEGNGADTFGTVYTIETTFDDGGLPTAGTITVLYDGDEDETRALRSPDNLDWASDGLIYVQEDKAETDSLSGELLFGEGATNTAEASIVQLNPADASITQVAEVDRSVVLDPSSMSDAVDNDAGTAGEWETSGILDVSALFGEPAGSLFVFDVQAHGIADQTDVNADSRINDDDLVEGGQLAFLIAR